MHHLCIQMMTMMMMIKVKVSSLQAIKAHGDVYARVHIIAAMAPGRGRVSNPILSCLYPQEGPSTHFIGG